MGRKKAPIIIRFDKSDEPKLRTEFHRPTKSIKHKKDPNLMTDEEFDEMLDEYLDE